MFTKRHMIELAGALQRSRPEPEDEVRWEQWKKDRAEISRALSNSNKNFDIRQFFAMTHINQRGYSS